MHLRHLSFLLPTALLSMGLGCLRHYVAEPLPRPGPHRAVQGGEGLEMGVKGFQAKEDIAAGFGARLAEKSQVIPVQVSLANRGQRKYRVLLTRVNLLETGGTRILPCLDLDKAYAQGQFTYGAPINWIVLAGVLGLPSLFTTLNANEMLWQDYQRKRFPDTVLAPCDSAGGVFFFDPAPSGLKRGSGFAFSIDLEDIATGATLTLS